MGCVELVRARSFKPRCGVAGWASRSALGAGVCGFIASPSGTVDQEEFLTTLKRTPNDESKKRQVLL